MYNHGPAGERNFVARRLARLPLLILAHHLEPLEDIPRDRVLPVEPPSQRARMAVELRLGELDVGQAGHAAVDALSEKPASLLEIRVELHPGRGELARFVVWPF